MSPRAAYGSGTRPSAAGGVVSAVDADSPAAQSGVVAGDTVIAVDGERVRDVIDWQWLSAERNVQLELIRSDGSHDRVLLSRDSGREWGIAFATPLFDAIRTCENRCAFCFMAQLPRGLRPSLYVRDDDFRLSFLQGNFITLTNLDQADIDRIANQRLSPLYVSLHAVTPEVRSRLVCARVDRALERFDDLLDSGIDLHVQVVLVPGVNDGEELDRTLTWLAQREGVASAGIVPLGYTAHQGAFSTSYESRHAALAVIEQVSAWQAAHRAEYGITWVHLADEFYLNAGIEIPEAATYDDFPQYENGIGMVRTFLDDVHSMTRELTHAIADLPEQLRIVIVSGTLFAPVLARVLEGLDSGERVTVRGVENRFFGGNVSVTGLLTAADIIPVLAEYAGPVSAVRDATDTTAEHTTVYLIPDAILSAEGTTLDDRTPAGIAEDARVHVRLVSCDAAGILAELRALADEFASGAFDARATSGPSSSTSRGDTP